MTEKTKWSILVANQKFVWANNIDRIEIIRKGLPYASVEVISNRINAPLKQILDLFNILDRSYSKNNQEENLLNIRDSEMILVLTELLDFGLDVFNNEEGKFQNWIKKPNISLGGVTPLSLFDSLTGIEEIRSSLNRIEYGNMA